jgi:iron(II)-dependent oxidoreductase
MSFSEDGGYERREWWSEEGWAWKQEHDVTHHPGIAAGHPCAAACHVSWFEAQAYARASEARLPSEAEWEKAASREPSDATGSSGEHLDREPSRDGKTPAKTGVLDGVGHVWEWTSSPFNGYPGFVAHPYREYSEVFFGGDYRVLRGGSWATRARVATATFRNWDHPQRRQIFSGLRIAKDV